MKKFTQHYRPGQTPQNEALPGQVANSAGGYSFPVDDWVRLDRFLILGTEGGTYYITEHELTRDAAKAVERALAEDGVRVVDRAVEISKAGRAPSNDPALFVHALASVVGDEATKARCEATLGEICRTGTHLFHWMDYRTSLGATLSGRFDRTVERWYLDKEPEKLAYQIIKYGQRDGWNHSRVLRMAKPNPAGKPAHNALFAYVKAKAEGEGLPSDTNLPKQVRMAERLRDVPVQEQADLIREHKLPREVVPTESLKNPTIWAALLEGMPLTAMVRNLANMTRCGLLTPMGVETKTVVDRLADTEWIRKSRLHPIQALLALKTYGSGGQAGRSQGAAYEPVQTIVDALDALFYACFENVEPTGKRWLLGLDVSSSMRCPTSATPLLSCSEGAAAMAMVTARTESQYAIRGFSNTFVDLAISPRQRLDDITRQTSRMTFGGTDCSLPMIWALQNQVDVDVFAVYTDSETWAGNQHPVEALREYRQRSGIPAKLVVVGMAGNGFSIADPNDAGMLDVVGFDASAPNLIADFAR